MEKLKDPAGKEVSLKDLIKETEDEILHEKRSEAKRLIRIILQRVFQLDVMINQSERELKKRKEQREKAMAKVKKLQEGDWSILNEDQKGGNKQKQDDSSADDDD